MNLFRFFIGLLFIACTISISAQTTTKTNIYNKKNLRTVMQSVFDWQVAHPVENNTRNNNFWARAAFYTGIMAAYRTTRDKKYLAQATQWATGREWTLGERPRHADDQAPG